MLVADLADDLFHHVFHGDQSRRIAVFVDDGGDVVAVLLHLAQQIVHRLGFGNEPDGTHQIAYTVRFAVRV